MPGPRSSLLLLVLAVVTLVLALLQGDTGWAIVGGCFTVSAVAALWRWYSWPRRIRRPPSERS